MVCFQTQNPNFDLLKSIPTFLKRFKYRTTKSYFNKNFFFDPLKEVLEKFSGNTYTGFSSWNLEDPFFSRVFCPFYPLYYTAHCCALIFSFLLSPPLWQGWHKKSPISHTAQKIVDGQKFCHGENCHLSKKLLYCNGLPEEKNWTCTTTKNRFITAWSFNILKKKNIFGKWFQLTLRPKWAFFQKKIC